MYLAYLIQPHGCDYTIACGHRLVTLQATEYDAAVAELRYLITTEYQGDIQLESATLIHAIQKADMPVADWYDAYEKGEKLQDQLEQDRIDRARYEELKRRFG